MGLAASQARYLQLTARKTNVEFQGQQVNQQRTELANESSGIFSQLMALQVPAAPSPQDYSKTQYTFYDGSNTCTITSMTPLLNDPDNNYTVSYYYNQKVDKGIGKTRTDLGVSGSGTAADPYWLTNGVTKVKQTQLTQCDDDDATNQPNDYSAILQICKDNANSALRNTCGYNEGTQTLATIEGAYKYTATNGTTYYYASTDLATAAAQGGAATKLTGYYSAQVTEKQPVTTPANITQEDSGRYSKITPEGMSTSFDMNAATTTDTLAYDAAVNEYEYKQAQYQQQVTALNAKTSIIQQEDRTLELKLSQLDTEQKALTAEMESVKKVIEKNIEQTFKTFS